MKMFKRLRKTHKLVGLLIIMALISFGSIGCWGTPKISRWTAPENVTLDQVFNAALRAGTENGFTIVNSDRTAGVISMKKQAYSGDKMTERYLSVRLNQIARKTVISTKVLGSDFGIIEGAMGGAVHGEITHNFYVYLFRELNINQLVDNVIIIEDEKPTPIDPTKRKEYERFLALDEAKKQQIISLHREIHKDLEKLDWNAVVQRCKKSIEIDPEDYFAYGTLGGAYAMLNEFDLSIEYSTKASQLIPALPDSYTQMVYAYARKGDKDRAFESLQKAVDRGFKDIDHIKNDKDLPEDFRNDPRLNNFIK